MGDRACLPGWSSPTPAALVPLQGLSRGCTWPGELMTLEAPSCQAAPRGLLCGQYSYPKSFRAVSFLYSPLFGIQRHQILSRRVTWPSWELTVPSGEKGVHGEHDGPVLLLPVPREKEKLRGLELRSNVASQAWPCC